MSTSSPLLVLAFPGLDGTGDLLVDFARLAPTGIRLQVQPLPQTDDQSYETLVELLCDVVEAAGPCVLLGESFSGPLVTLLARRCPEQVQGVVYAASFVTSPEWPITRWLPSELMFGLPLSYTLARWLFSGYDASREHLAMLDRTIHSVPAAVLAARLRAAVDVDVRAELSSLECPVGALVPTEDQLIPHHCLTLMQEVRDDLLVRRLPGPHLVLERYPQECWWELIAMFTDWGLIALPHSEDET
ncbi:MAG: alpha/beta hydrolase [Planctomycetaceae bacterium]|nr:alpha/beta hydrolase [Planctomycetaceae bacterium]